MFYSSKLSLSLSYAVSVFALGPFTSLLFIGVRLAHLSTICLSYYSKKKNYLSLSYPLSLYVSLNLSLSQPLSLSLIWSPSSLSLNHSFKKKKLSLNHCLCLSHITYLLTVIFSLSLSLFHSLAHYLTLLFFQRQCNIRHFTCCSGPIQDMRYNARGISLLQIWSWNDESLRRFYRPLWHDLLHLAQSTASPWPGLEAHRRYQRWQNQRRLHWFSLERDTY